MPRARPQASTLFHLLAGFEGVLTEQRLRSGWRAAVHGLPRCSAQVPPAGVGSSRR